MTLQIAWSLQFGTLNLTPKMIQMRMYFELVREEGVRPLILIV